MKNVVSKVWIWIGLYKHAANNNEYFFIMNKYITYGLPIHYSIGRLLYLYYKVSQTGIYKHSIISTVLHNMYIVIKIAATAVMSTSNIYF